jgi:hypothetical protein
MNINIDKVNNKDLNNIELLKNRKKGDIYYSDNKGILNKLSFIEKIFYLLSKFFSTEYSIRIQLGVKNTLNDLICRVTSGDKNELTDLFFNKLCSLSEEIYDRSKINSKVLSVLKNSLKNYAEYQSLCEKQNLCKKDFLIFSRIIPSEKVRYENIEKIKNVALEALLSVNLGIRTAKPGLGRSETYFIKDINGKIVGIFKSASGDSLSPDAPDWWARWRNKFFTSLGIGGSTYKFLPGKCHIAEYASYDMDESIKTNVVPPTTIMDLDPLRWTHQKPHLQKGSLQIFMPNMKEATEFLGIYKNYKPEKTFDKNNKPQLSDELFEKLIIVDVVTGNLDRHAENWLIEVDKDNPTKAKNIVLIDGGMAFSPTHADSILERKKQYYWATTAFEWSIKRFSSKAKEVINDVYERRFELRNKLIKIYTDQGDKYEIAEMRGDRMIERIEMLKYVAVKKDMKRYKLIHYRTQEEFDQLKASKGIEPI